MPFLRLLAVPGTRPRRARRGRRRHVPSATAPSVVLPDVALPSVVLPDVPLGAIPAQAQVRTDDALPPHARSWGPRPR